MVQRANRPTKVLLYLVCLCLVEIDHLAFMDFTQFFQSILPATNVQLHHTYTFKTLLLSVFNLKTNIIYCWKIDTQNLPFTTLLTLNTLLC